MSGELQKYREESARKARIASSPSFFNRLCRLVFALALGTTSLGQAPLAAAADAPPLILEHLTPSEGMPQSTVMATLQDSQGFIWLGTQDGLVRYDGHDLVRYAYSRNAANTLPGNFIWQIVEDPHHDLWVALKDAGIARWNRATDSFTVFRHDPKNVNSIASDTVRALLIDSRGRIWVGTSDAGIDILDLDSGQIQHFRHDPAQSGSLSDDRIFTLSQDRQGSVWAGTAHGLDQFQFKLNGVLHVDQNAAALALLSGTQISQISEDTHGTRWIGTYDGGLNRVDTRGVATVYRHKEADPTSLSSDDVRAVLEDREGHLWVGTPEGLDLLEPSTGKFTHYRHDEGDSGSLRDSFVMSLYEDTAGLVWIGTQAGGVSRWNPRSWELGGHRPAWLVGKLVTSFADASDGKIWIGSVGGGLDQFNAESGDVVNIDAMLGRANALGDQRVMALRTGHDDALWIGTMRSGLKKLLPNGQLTSIPIKPGDATATSAAGIMTIFESRAGEIWLGTHGGGVNIVNPSNGSIRQLPHTAGTAGAVSGDNVSAIAEDTSGNIWIGTDGGGLDLAGPDGRVVKVFKHDLNDPASMPSNTIFAIAVDSHGDVWVATDKGGVVRVLGTPADPERIRFEVTSRDEGLSSDTIWGVLTDAAGQLWMSGNSGLMRMDPQSHQIKTFHREHGLQGEEFDFNAYLRLRDGRLCFGGPGGFNIFDPLSLTDNGHAPRVALTRMEVLGAPVPSATPYWLLNRVVVDHRASIISLDFGALDFTSPKRNRLQYRVNGLSDQWIDLGTQHRVTLTNLDAGDHLLEVRAANADSVWSDPPLRLVVHREAAPWRSPWAYAIYAIVLLLLILYRIRASRAQLERVVQAKERLESEVALRTRELVQSNRELGEASQAKSNFLARMSHELRTPMNGVVGSSELLLRTAQSSTQHRLTETIRSSAGVLLQIVNDLLDLAKIQAGKLELESVPLELNRILEECTTLFAGAAEKKNIELIVCPSDGEQQLLGDPLRVRQILMNLVGNAVKFTSQGEILVKADLVAESSSLVTAHLWVTDSGIGMDAETIARIFEPFAQADESMTRRYGGSGLGLAICRELAERLGGSIDVNSTPNVGSVFHVVLPMRASAVPVASSADSPLGKLRILTSNLALHDAVARQVAILGYGISDDAPLTIADFSCHQPFIDTALATGTPVIVLASSSQIERLQTHYPLDGDALVHKPVHRDELGAALLAVAAPRSNRRVCAMTPGLAPINAHVLLVEDEAVNAAVAQGYLAELGCSSVWVTNGAEAIARSGAERFDLIMMDLNMPTMDGLTAAEHIRRAELSARRVPIVATTAHDAKHYLESCLLSGMDDLLSKPYSLDECSQLIRRWVKTPSAAIAVQALAKVDEADLLELCAIDLGTVGALRNLQGVGSEDLYSQLIDLFRRSCRDTMAQLRAALERQDCRSAGSLGHKLAAAAANVGALAFGREARRLEGACAANDAALAEHIAVRLERAYFALDDKLSQLQLRATA